MTNLPDRVKSANRAVFDRGASRYDEENPAHYNRVTQARIAEVLDIIRQGADGGRLLDAGCGTGNVLREARNRFSEVFQFDISFEMCRRAAGKGADVVCADFDHIPFPAETFSGVTAFSVIHHLVDQKTLLAETFRVLQPGGFFYADYDPNRFHDATRRGRVYDRIKAALVRLRGSRIRRHEHPPDGHGEAELAEYGHHVLKGLNPAELEEQLRAAGFREVRFYFHDDYSSLDGCGEQRRWFRRFGRLVGFVLGRTRPDFFPYLLTLARK